MEQTVHKAVAPFYAAAVVWLGYALLFPLYKGVHYAIAGGASLLVFALAALLCKSGAKPQAAEKAKKKEEEKPTGNAELDKMLKDGRLALAEMKRLDENIKDEAISADIVQLEAVSEKIFAQVKQDPKKLPQIRKFMDYYLPTTLKLLNSYDRMSAQGVSGENIDSTMRRVEGMMRNVVAAFTKQLDALFGSEALDISTDVTVLENMMAREGLGGEQLHAQSAPKADGDIKLEI